MFIVPITLISCASRGEAWIESTTSRESITVSISAACTIRRSSACWVPTRTNSVRSSSSVGSSGLTPMIVSTLLVALERLRELAAPEGRDAGDEDAAHPNQTERRWASMSISSSWMRARISSATVWTRPRSCQGSSPHWSVGIGSRKRILNFAGR